MRKKYQIRFAGRLVIFSSLCLTYLLRPAAFSILRGVSFFSHISILHVAWIVWMGDMILQLLPARKFMSLGAQKQFFRNFRPASVQRPSALRAATHANNMAALKVFLLWSAVTAALGILHARQILGNAELLLVTGFFYISDLVCVLFWCPFRVFFLKNRCCITCRIFNWDHLMMFCPLIFVGGFYAVSLVAMAAVVFLVWELFVRIHPERFWEGTNAALLCGACQEFLCGKKHPAELPNPTECR